MILGIVLHTSNIYEPAQRWMVYSDETSVLAGVLTNFIGSFRMPAFFLISGFFCAMTLQRYGAGKFVKVRMKRILVPLIATGLLLGAIQEFILVTFGGETFDPTEHFLQGGWIQHLWFLIILLVYFFVATIVYFIAKDAMAKIGQLIAPKLLNISMLAVLLLLPLASVAISASTMVGFPLYTTHFFDIVNLNYTMTFAPYFVFGLLLFSHHALLEHFTTISAVKLLAALAVVLVMRYWLVGIIPEVLEHPVTVYTQALRSWIMIIILFKLFQHFFNEKSDFWFFMSDASYTIYLFHHLIVISLGLIVTHYSAPPLAGLVIIIVLTTLITVLIHKYLISKSRLLRFTFNGK